MALFPALTAKTSLGTMNLFLVILYFQFETSGAKDAASDLITQLEDPYSSKQSHGMRLRRRAKQEEPRRNFMHQSRSLNKQQQPKATSAADRFLPPGETLGVGVNRLAAADPGVFQEDADFWGVLLDELGVSPDSTHMSMMPSAVPTDAPSITTKLPTSPPNMVVDTEAPTTIEVLDPEPTSLPTISPTTEETEAPTIIEVLDPEPTSLPTISPTTEPTATPTNLPTTMPTMSPTTRSSEHPSGAPSPDPTQAPVTATPTMTGSDLPSSMPSPFPTNVHPSAAPSPVPTQAPATTVPTVTASDSPSSVPSPFPTVAPSAMPSATPLTWQQTAAFSSTESFDRFGWSVSLNDAGSVIAAGAYLNGENENGLTRIFAVPEDTNATELASLPGDSGAMLGGSVAMDGTGTLLASAGMTSVQLYRPDIFGDGAWKLDSALSFDQDTFPGSYIVTVSKDQSTLAVGSWGANEGVGAVRTFTYSPASQSWNVRGQNLVGNAPQDLWGFGMALDGTGDTLVISAVRGNETRGFARMYKWQDRTALWEQVGSDIVGEMPGEYLGRAVDLSMDGSVLAVGTYQCPSCEPAGTGPGYVQVYQVDKNDELVKLGDAIQGPQDRGQFGISVSLSENGKTMAVGANAYSDTANGLSASGLVQVFEHVEAEWIQVGQDVVGTSNGKNLGVSLDISADGKAFAVGGPVDSSAERPGIGDTFVYRLV